MAGMSTRVVAVFAIVFMNLVDHSSLIPIEKLSAPLSSEPNLFGNGEDAGNNDAEKYEGDTAMSYYTPWQKTLYPNPVISPKSCRRSMALSPPPSHVCDPDGILTDDQVQMLEKLIAIVQAVTPCLCDNETCSQVQETRKGVAIGVALARTMYTGYQESPDVAARNFAKHLRESWQLEKCGDDILIFVAVNNQQSVSDVGPNAQQLLPPELTDEIFRDKGRGHFNNSHFFQGLEAMILAFRDVLLVGQRRSLSMNTDLIESDADEDNENALFTGSTIGIIVALMIVTVIVVFAIIFLQKRLRGEHEKFHLGKAGWKKDNLRPISVNPINSPGGVYEPCSTEDNGQVTSTPRKLQEEYYDNEDPALNEAIDNISDEEGEANVNRPRGLSAVQEETEDENQESSSDKEASGSRPTTQGTIIGETIEIHNPKGVQRTGDDEPDVVKV